jgi:ABC-2 type transport system permease protein
LEAVSVVSGKRIYSDFKVFSRGYLRNKFGLFFGLVFPVILILIFGAIFSSSGTGTLNVYAQNQDAGAFGQNIGDNFLAALNESSTLRVITVNASDNFADYLAAHSAADGIIIPQDFTANYLAGQQVNLTVYGNPASSSSGIVSGTVGGYVDFLIPGLIGFSILTSPMFSLVNISSEYKKNKLFKQLSLTPLTKMEWLTSKMLWYIVLTIAGFLLMVGVGVAAFGAHVTLTPWLIPFLALGPMLFAALGMLVGTVTKNPETAGVIGNIVTFPMMFLAGTFFPISIMPTYLQNFAHVLPLFYIVEGLNNVMVYGNLTGAAIDLAVVAVITAVIFILAVKLFKWRED